MRPLAPIVRASGIVIPDGYVLTNVIASSVDGSLLGVEYDSQGSRFRSCFGCRRRRARSRSAVWELRCAGSFKPLAGFEERRA